MSGPARVEDLETEVRYHRQRYDLYRAKSYGPRSTSQQRLQELERAYRGAQSRLRDAQERDARAADERGQA